MSNETTFLYVWISSLSKIYCIHKSDVKLSTELLYDENFLYNFFITHFNLNNEDYNQAENIQSSEKASNLYFTLIKFINHFNLNQAKSIKKLFNSFSSKESRIKIWKIIFTITFLEDFSHLLKKNTMDKTMLYEKSFINPEYEASIINYNHDIPKKFTILSIMKSIVLFKLAISIINETLGETEVGYNEIENLIQSNFNETLNESKLEVIYNIDRNHNEISNLNENCMSNNVSIINETAENNLNIQITDRTHKSNFMIDFSPSKDKDFKKIHKCDKCELNYFKTLDFEKKIENFSLQILNLRNINSKLEDENQNCKSYIDILHNDKNGLENSIKTLEKKVNLVKQNEKLLKENTQEIIYLNEKISEDNEKIADLQEIISSKEDLESNITDYKLSIKILKNENLKLKIEAKNKKNGGNERKIAQIEKIQYEGKKVKQLYNDNDLNNLKSSLEIANASFTNKFQDLLQMKNEIIDEKMKENENLKKKYQEIKIINDLKESKMKMLEHNILTLNKSVKKKEKNVKILNTTLAEQSIIVEKNSNNIRLFMLWSVFLAAIIFVSLYFSIIHI